MHFAKMRYAVVVTEIGRYMAGSEGSPFSLKMGESTARTMVSDMRPSRRHSANSLLRSGATLSLWRM